MEYKRHWNKVCLYLCFSKTPRPSHLGIYTRGKRTLCVRVKMKVPERVPSWGAQSGEVGCQTSAPDFLFRWHEATLCPCCCATVPFTSWGIQLAALKCVLWGKWEHDAGDISQRRQHSKGELGQAWHACAARGHFRDHSRWALAEVGGLRARAPALKLSPAACHGWGRKPGV